MTRIGKDQDKQAFFFFVMPFSLSSWYLLTKGLRTRNHHDIVNTGLLLHGEFLPVSMVSSTSAGHQTRDSGQSGDCPTAQ